MLAGAVESNAPSASSQPLRTWVPITTTNPVQLRQRVECVKNLLYLYINDVRVIKVMFQKPAERKHAFR